MVIKDYYKILEVQPSASQQDIKKAFRKLAHRFHPDKHAGSKTAEARYREIQEAYTILSDPGEREQYNYKRWFNRTTKQDYSNTLTSAGAILQESVSLKNYVQSVSMFHVNYLAVSNHIQYLLNETTIGIVQENNDLPLCRQVIQNLLLSCQPLPLTYIQPLSGLLYQLAGEDKVAMELIRRFLQLKKRLRLWDRMKWLLVILILLTIFWIMFHF